MERRRRQEAAEWRKVRRGRRSTGVTRGWWLGGAAEVGKEAKDDPSRVQTAICPFQRHARSVDDAGSAQTQLRLSSDSAAQSAVQCSCPVPLSVGLCVCSSPTSVRCVCVPLVRYAPTPPVLPLRSFLPTHRCSSSSRPLPYSPDSRLCAAAQRLCLPLCGTSRRRVRAV